MKTERGEEWIFCSQLEEMLGEFDCCSSCHDEWDHGIGGLSWREFIKDGKHYYVEPCCGASKAIDQAIKDGRIKELKLTLFPKGERDER